MRNVAIIPARAGSKGIPGKNLKVLGGLTLTHRALSVAYAAQIFEDIILTTDIPLLLEEKTTRWLSHERPNDLAKDETPMADVVTAVIEKFGIKDDALLWLLQPTSPFREVSHFHKILEIFVSQKIGRASCRERVYVLV